MIEFEIFNTSIIAVTHSTPTYCTYSRAIPACPPLYYYYIRDDARPLYKISEYYFFPALRYAVIYFFRKSHVPIMCIYRHTTYVIYPASCDNLCVYVRVWIVFRTRGPSNNDISHPIKAYFMYVLTIYEPYEILI